MAIDFNIFSFTADDMERFRKEMTENLAIMEKAQWQAEDIYEALLDCDDSTDVEIADAKRVMENRENSVSNFESLLHALKEAQEYLFYIEDDIQNNTLEYLNK